MYASRSLKARRPHAVHRCALLAVSTTALAACDALFPISGTLTSGHALPLEGCWLIYESRDRQQTASLTTPHFQGGFATDRVPKTVVITCDRHQPKVVAVPHGGDVGEIVLFQASNSTPTSSSPGPDAAADDGSTENVP